MIIDASSTIEEFNSKKELESSLLSKNYPVQMQNVFEVDTGVTEWIVAVCPDEVKAFLKVQMGLDDDDIENCTIQVCDNELLQKLSFKEEDGTVTSMYQEFHRQIKERAGNFLYNKPFSLATTEY